MSKAAVHGDGENNELRAVYNDKNGSYLAGNGGDDILRGGHYNDILVGGEGDDLMFGGRGADTFRFFGENGTLSYQKPAGNDVDRIFDLNFADGDRLDFQEFAKEGANAMIRSFDDLVALVNNGSGWTATEQTPGNPKNDNLVLHYDMGDGVSQTIIISNAWDAFHAASTVG